MQPSSPSSRGNSRVGSVKYAHSPYVYRTTVDDAPVSPMSDHGRSEPGSVAQYHSPRSLSQSTGNADGTGVGTGGSQVDLHSQPNSPLGRSTTTSNQEYSQPIQVGSAPNVHARYRRGIQSPMSRPGNESGNRSAFPSSPAGSLPPRSSFMAREDSTGTFSTGGESAPVRGGLNNPYRLPSAAGLSAPQYTMPLSSSYRGGNGSGVAAASGGGGGGGGGSGSHHSSPLHGRQHSGSMAPVSPAFLPRPTSPSSGPSAAPAYGSSTANNANSNTNNSYAPTGFSMPPTMATAGSGSYHGPPSGRAGSHSASYVDPRSSHPSSPLLGANGRPLAASSSYPREPVSPTHLYSSGTYGGPVGPDGTPYSPSSNSRGSNGAQPPAFATAVQHQQQLQQQHPNGSFGLGSFPGRRSAPPGHSSSPFTSHMSLHTAGNDTALMSESYGTNTKTLSTMADDTMSSSGKSGSSASSIRDDLPLCPNDDACTTINDRKHQKKYAHTCRLFPCYHGHVTRHAKLFRHAPGQISLPEGLSANTKVSSHALASVNFSTISPEAPNAYRIYVSHGDKSYEIFGDWASVKVHTFKRYLHQVYHIAPGCQILSVQKTGKVMDDDINTVKCYGIEEDSVIQLRSDSEDAQAPGRLRIPLDDL